MINTRQLKLNIRNFINDITGQTPKIEEYSYIISTLAKASDKEEDENTKNEIHEAYVELDEEVWITNGHGGGTVSGFNQYKNFQNNKLALKIETGRELLKKFNLPQYNK